MRSSRNLVSTFLALAAFSGTVAAETIATGTISGRIDDLNTRLSLGGVRVTLSGYGIDAYTNGAGEFFVSGVPAGNHTLVFSYVGYPEMRRVVTVPANGNARVQASFGAETVQMEAFVIRGSLVGQARALNSQRASTTLTSVVAADEIGRFPDQNAAESLQRLPGVSLYRDQGEGRYVDLRGLNYIYTSVNLNGAKVASPELGDRAIALDVLPSDAMSSLEVTKAPTPDMDAEGLGGSINLKTRSPFDYTGREIRVTAQDIYTHLTGKNNMKGGVTYADQFADGRIGVLADISWQERDFGSQNYEEDGLYSSRTASNGSTGLVVNNLGFRDYVINRERLGLNASVEFRPQTGTRVYLRGTYNRFTDTEDRHQLYIPFERGTLASVSETGFAVTGMSRVRRDIRIREKDQELRAFSTGFEHKSGQLTLDGQVGYSKGEEHRPEELTVRIRRKTADTGMSFQASDVYDLQVVQTAGASLADPASFTEVDRIEMKNDEGRDTEANVALNGKYQFETMTPSYLKFGTSYRAKDKVSESDVTRFKAPSTFTFSSLSEGASEYPYGPQVPRFSHDKVLEAFKGNRSAFTPTVQVVDSAVGDWRAKEGILAGYAMGGMTFGSTQVVSGLRMEKTRFRTWGHQVEDESVITPVYASKNYTNLLPGLFLREDFSKKLIGRASYSQSIMRPSFGESAAFRSVGNDSEEVEAGNPELEELRSNNFDLSLEYYLDSLGVVSASLFSKRIENFSYAVTLEGADKATGYDLITWRNGSEGKIEGMELAYSQQLRMLPGVLSGLGVLVNGTFTQSSAQYPTRVGEKLPFIGQSNRTGNFALTYEKGKFFVRAAVNYRSEHLREDEPIGSTDREDRWVDEHKQLDLSASYKVTKGLEVFAEFNNLTNEPFRVYVKGSGANKRIVQFEEYDWTANVGVRWKL